jgi:cephalosporin hydroxylase
MNLNVKFKNKCDANVDKQGIDKQLQMTTSQWMKETVNSRYSYNYSYLGRPIIQYPQDMVAMQELIWDVKPDLVIEAGIAHGGSLILSASMLALLDYCDAQENSKLLDPSNPKRKILGIDIDIRSHNREAIEAHPMFPRIEMIEGSSINDDIVKQVNKFANDYERILVCLDSNHTHEHVLAELEAYAPLVSLGSYCIVSDTIVEDAPDHLSSDRPWGKGNNPKTAVWKYLETHKEFKIDKSIQHKLLITVAPDGYLKRV